MPDVLSWQEHADGITFKVHVDGATWPISTWGRSRPVGPHGHSRSTAPLATAVEARLAEGHDDNSLTLPHLEIESFSERQISQLGLPPVAPLRLRIRGDGLVISPQFRLHHELVGTDGVPIMGAHRTGSIIAIGARRYTLLYPLYSLLEEIARFSDAGASSMSERMLRWANLKELLPESAQVDDHLRSMNIVRADAFSLDTNGQADIAPVLRHKRKQALIPGGDAEDALDSVPVKAEDALPDVAQKSFADRFSRGRDVKSRYTTDGHWYVILPPEVQKGLDVVKRYQSAPLGERLAFIANPKRILRNALEAELPDDVIDHLFEETPAYLSQRIRCLGLWHSKSFSYSSPSTNSWFPDEDSDACLAIDLGDVIVPVTRREAPNLHDQMQQAQTRGESEIEFGEHRIAVTPETIARVESAIENSRTVAVAQEEATRKPADEACEDGPLVPLIDDNLDSLEFSHRPHPPRCRAGGLPAVLKTTTLFPHQEQGLRWLQEHWAVGSNGALLADDMGLGKTLQTLAFLAWVQEKAEAGAKKPLLIVAPTGLLKNWEDEAQTHLSSPGLGTLLRAYGKDLKPLTLASSHDRRRQFESADWVMTTYETLRDKIQYFMDIHWAVVAYDEVQKIKNPTSLVHDMAKSVHSDFYLALTGTPIENRIADIWAIIDTVAPGHLRSLKDFQDRYEKDTDAADAVDHLESLRTTLLKDPTPTRVLRRMKSDHLRGLPSKEETCHRRTMPDMQAARYEAVLDDIRSDDQKKAGRVLKALQQLRRVSLLAEEPGQEGLTDEAMNNSARMSAVVALLDDIAARGEKALIFVEYRTVQDELILYLQKRYAMRQPPRRINGQTNGHQRKKLVDAFQAGDSDRFDVMVLSPKAAGVGLTLTAANHVIHLSRWWNPAVEDQCTDRIFRIGQQNPVHVHYPIAVHPKYPDSSFDINLHALLERKRRLSQGLLAPADAQAHELDDLLKGTLA